MTLFKQVADNAKATIPSNAANSTTDPLTIGSINTTKLPALGNGYYVTIYDKLTFPDPADDPNMEKCLVTAVTVGAAGSITLTRGQLGTTAKAHAGSPALELLFVAQLQQDVHNAINTTETNIASNTAALAAKENTANKGVASGYAGLDGTGKVPAAQLPSYVDDVLEYANLAALPATGATGLIYVTLDTNKTYRWSGSAYVEISPSDVNSVAGKTGVVTLVKGDVGLGNVDNTADSAKAFAATQITSGTVPTARLGSGTANSSSYLRGDQTWAPIGGGGQTLVTKIVAASGGDYTTLGAALAAASSGWTIWVQPGTYTESNISCTLNGITILGAGAIIDIAGNSFVAIGTDWRIEDLKFTSTFGGITIANNDNLRFFNNKIVSSGNASHTFTGSGAIISNCTFSTAASQNAAHFSLGGLNCMVSNNLFIDNPTKSTGGVISFTTTEGTITGNTFMTNTTGSGALVYLGTADTTFSGNAIYDNLGCVPIYSGGGVSTITGNSIHTSGPKGIRTDGGNSVISANHVRISNTAGVAISLEGGGEVCTGNFIFAALGTSIGIRSTSGGDLINGNYIRNSTTGVQIDAGTNAIVTSNRAFGATTAVSDSGTTTTKANNV